MNKSKEKDNKVININSKSKEKDNKVIVLNKSKGKDNKLVNTNSKSKGKDNPNPNSNSNYNSNSHSNENKKEPTMATVMQKNVNVNGNNKISLNKNIKEVKKGNKSPNPGNGVVKKKIVVSNPKQKQGTAIKISPGKISKEKINSAKVRLNTDNANEVKKPLSKQGPRPVKTAVNRKVEKSPNGSSNKK